jgi:hypothetical protein
MSHAGRRRPRSIFKREARGASFTLLSVEAIERCPEANGEYDAIKGPIKGPDTISAQFLTLDNVSDPFLDTSRVIFVQ